MTDQRIEYQQRILGTPASEKCSLNNGTITTPLIIEDADEDEELPTIEQISVYIEEGGKNPTANLKEIMAYLERKKIHTANPTLVYTNMHKWSDGAEPIRQTIVADTTLKSGSNACATEVVSRSTNQGLCANSESKIIA
jgi:hypothetical protein